MWAEVSLLYLRDPSERPVSQYEHLSRVVCKTQSTLEKSVKSEGWRRLHDGSRGYPILGAWTMAEDPTWTMRQAGD